MNWDAIGAIGQVLGSVAVFVTLGYLAVQVRHARSEARRALSQSRGDAFRAMLAIECDPHIRGIDVRLRSALRPEGYPGDKLAALSEQTGMSHEEIVTMFWKEYGWWIYRVGIMSHIDDLPVMERFMFDNAVRSAYGNPGPGRTFYESMFKQRSHPDSVRYVDNLLAQPG